jgi:hypothetical protein
MALRFIWLFSVALSLQIGFRFVIVERLVGLNAAYSQPSNLNSAVQTAPKLAIRARHRQFTMTASFLRCCPVRSRNSNSVITRNNLTIRSTLC